MKLDETMLTAHDRERIARYALLKATQLIAEVKTNRIRFMNETIKNRVN